MKRMTTQQMDDVLSEEQAERELTECKEPTNEEIEEMADYHFCRLSVEKIS